MKLPTVKELFALLLIVLLSPATALADEEASNRAYVTASKYGQFYAKSVPHERYGLKGVTSVYRVTDAEDVLLQSYDWYSPRLSLEGFGDTIYVVQMGPWHRGWKASKSHHALAFYKNDKLLKKHSTLDIAGAEDNVFRSVSHYTIFSGEPVFRRPFGNRLVFDIKTHKGVTLSFDTETGTLISKDEERLKKILYETRGKIARIKWRWYGKHKEQIPDINNFMITEEALRLNSPDDFPDLPEGYRYIPSTVRKAVRIEKVDD